jgi:hypothetical protein
MGYEMFAGGVRSTANLDDLADTSAHTEVAIRRNRGFCWRKATQTMNEEPSLLGLANKPGRVICIGLNVPISCTSLEMLLSTSTGLENRGALILRDAARIRFGISRGTEP